MYTQSGKSALQMAKETECLEIVELIERHTATAHDPNVSGVNINWVVSGFLACTLNRLIYSALIFRSTLHHCKINQLEEYGQLCTYLCLQDPFLRVLGNYLEKVEASKCHVGTLPGVRQLLCPTVYLYT